MPKRDNEMHAKPDGTRRSAISQVSATSSPPKRCGRAARGQNAPQKVALRPVCRAFSGTPLPRRAQSTGAPGSTASALRLHTSHIDRLPTGWLRSAPFDEVPAPPNQLRWIPCRFRTSHGFHRWPRSPWPATASSHSYGVAIQSMLPILMGIAFSTTPTAKCCMVPQTGRLLLHTEMGILGLPAKSR